MRTNLACVLSIFKCLLGFLVENKMASLLFTLLSSHLGAGFNATAFAGASLGFSMLRDDGGKESKNMI